MHEHCSRTNGKENWMNLNGVMNPEVVLMHGLTAEFADPIKTQKETLMTNEELFLAVALNGWKGNIERADKTFSGLSEEELRKEVAPGKNRLIYLWGHLTATHDAMLSLLVLGSGSIPGSMSRSFPILIRRKPEFPRSSWYASQAKSRARRLRASSEPTIQASGWPIRWKSRSWQFTSRRTILHTSSGQTS